MDFSNSFYIHVISNDSMDTYPQNKAHTFVSDLEQLYAEFCFLIKRFTSYKRYSLERIEQALSQTNARCKSC